MGDTQSPLPVLPIMATFSRYPDALAWGRERAVERFGPIAMQSEPFEFAETAYYESTMGPGLRKQFWAFERLADPAELAAWKTQTNQWEAEYAALAAHEESRPLNLDPGYITAAKLVLASTKDHAHRIYLTQGIYAEITLFYRHRRWEAHEWTFPDYRRADYQEFFSRCREHFRRAISSDRD
jgi:hypothetical protein